MLYFSILLIDLIYFMRLFTPFHFPPGGKVRMGVDMNIKKKSLAPEKADLKAIYREDTEESENIDRRIRDIY